MGFDFWAKKTVCVTGGTGFLGWHLVRQLLPLAGHVRILGLPPASPLLEARLRNLDCVLADVRDAAAVRRAVQGCDVVFHSAGPVAVWGPALESMHDIHLTGTRNVVNALPEHARLVLTSSVVAVGAWRRRKSLTEDSPFSLDGLKVDYVHAKRAAEQLALAAARAGRDVLAVNPAYLVGPEDYQGSIMGKFCLRCWKGKVPLVPPGGFNFVDVRDVARGHILAAERGQAGRRYILAGENLDFRDFMNLLCEARGLAPRWKPRMPWLLQAMIAGFAEVRARLCGREPFPAMQHVRLNRFSWFYRSDRAMAELGYQPRPIRRSLADAHEWFCQNGWLKPRHDDPSVPRQRRAA